MFSLKMYIFHKSWYFNFAGVMPCRWAGLLSMCRSFQYLKEQRRRNEEKCIASTSRSYFSLLSCYKLCLLASIINKGCDVQYQIHGLHRQKYLPIFFQSAIFCTGLTNVQIGGICNANSVLLLPDLCTHGEMHVRSLTRGTAPPSLCTFRGSMASSSWHCLGWEDCHPPRLLASTALSCWDFTPAVQKWNM